MDFVGDNPGELGKVTDIFQITIKEHIVSNFDNKNYAIYDDAH